MGRGKRKEENPREVLEWMTEVQLQQVKLEGKIYERFMNSLKEYLDSNRDTARKHSGPLSVEKLGCDAWENWGKNDGVVCFGLVGPYLLKIYLANPSNLSVYHVVDFVYKDFGLDPEELEAVRVDYAMVGSKIYVLFCEATGYTVPVAVYYCDVANPDPYGGDGGYYKWENGPELKEPKREYCVFVLDGSIYVLGVGASKIHKHNSSFEVLKSGSDKWEMLDVPPIFTLYTSIPMVGGTFVDEHAKMILVLVSGELGHVLCTYYAEQNKWMEMASPFDTEGKIPKTLPLNGYGLSRYFLRKHRHLAHPLGQGCASYTLSGRRFVDNLFFWNLSCYATAVWDVHVRARVHRDDRRPLDNVAPDFAYSLFLIPLLYDSKVGSYFLLLNDLRKKKKSVEDSEDQTLPLLPPMPPRPLTADDRFRCLQMLQEMLRPSGVLNQNPKKKAKTKGTKDSSSGRSVGGGHARAD